MKKISKRILAVSLTVMMVASSFSFANTTANQPYQASAEPAEKLIGFDGVDLSTSEPIRVIVSFDSAPVIATATSKGLHVEDMSAAEVNTLTANIEKEQASVLQRIESEVGKFEVIQQFTNVFNGVSMTVDANKIEEISKIEGVVGVHAVNVYLRPEPQMSNSPQLTQSKFVNEKLGFTGEGMVVAIIDTGLDVEHQDMKIDADKLSKVAFTNESVNAAIAKNNLKGHYINAKVPYGYNYMDNDHIVKDIASDASMHGMHVGGTVAANGIIKGVAPNAQLLALKVFGNDSGYGSTYSDIIIAAIDDAIILGADVMNLSLGSTAAFVDKTDPEQQAVTRAVENGILMSISAGNSAHFGNGNAKTASMPFATNPDIGVSGAPGLTAESMMVASVDNATFLYTHTIEAAGLTFELKGYGKDDWVDGSYKLVALKGDKLGKNEDNYADVNLTGKVALIKRGTHAFADKTAAAAAHGAAAVICYNGTPPGFLWKNQGGWEVPFMLTDSNGVSLESLVANAPNGELDIKVTTSVTELDPLAGKSSAFTSWGTTPDMGFKPDISAPGGSIYSTLNDNKYGFMSGTSMAAPHAAGGAALLLQRLNTTNDFKNLYVTEKEKVNLAKAILMNTGRAVADTVYDKWIDENGYQELVTYTSPRRQGAGSMDLKSASLTQVVVYDKSSGRDFQASHNAGLITDGFNFTLTAFNQGTVPASYGLDAVVQTNKEKNGFNMLESMILDQTKVIFKIDGKVVDSITIPAGSSVDLEVSVDVKDAILGDTGKPFATAFPNGNFVEGFVFFYTQADGTNTPISTLQVAFNAAVKANEDNNLIIKALTEQIIVAQKAVVDAKNAIVAPKAAYDAALVLQGSQDNNAKLVADLKKAEDDLAALILANGTLESVQAKVTALEALNSAKIVNAAALANVLLAQGELATLNMNSAALATKLITDKQVVTDLEKEIATLMATPGYSKAEAARLMGLAEAAEAVVAATEKAIADNAVAITAQESVVDGLQKLATTATENVTTAEALLVTLNIKVEDADAIKAGLEALTTATKLVAEALKAQAEQSIILTPEQLAVIGTIPALKTALELATKLVSENEAIVTDLTKQLNDAKAKTAKLIADIVAAETAYSNGSQEQRYALPVSVPFISFKGDWAQAPAFDGLRGTKDSFYGAQGLLFNNSDEDTGYYMGKVSAFSPNGDNQKDSIASVVSFIRNLKNVTGEIQNAAGKKIKVIGNIGDQRKDYYDSKAGAQYSYLSQLKWDGRANMKVVADGTYAYVIKGTLDDKNATVKELRFPVMVDTKAPIFESVVMGTKVIAKFNDATSGIASYSAFKLTADPSKPLLLESNVTGEFNLAAKGVVAGDKIIFAAMDNAENLGLSTEITIARSLPQLDVDKTAPAPYTISKVNEILFKGTVTSASPYTLTIGNQVVKTEPNANTPQLAFEYKYLATNDGKYEVPVTVTDIYGNKNSFARHFFVDKTAPTLEVLEVKADGKIVEITNGVFAAPNGTESISVKIKAGDNFPDLNIRVNESLAYSTGKDFQGSRDTLKPSEITFVHTFDVDPADTELPLVIDVTDATGWVKTLGFTGYAGTTVGANLYAKLNGITEKGATPEASLPGQPSVPKPVAPGTNANTVITPVITPPVVNTPVVNTPVVNTPVVNSPVVNTPVVNTPVINTPVIITPVKPLASVTATATNQTIAIEEPKTPLGAVSFEKPYINGTKDGKFNADGSITRAEFAKMLAVILELDVNVKGTNYSDASNAWYTSYVKAISDAKILTGYANGSFKPNQPITREEIAQALANVWAYKHISVASYKSNLKDIAGSKSADAISKLNGLGVISGYNNTFRPNDTATRAEAVKMINIFINREVKEVTTSRFADVTGHWALKHIAAASK